MLLYIIRHGETPWNTKGLLEGHADIELNENGRRLARITAEKMKEIPFDVAFSSPLKRAYETAEIILGGRNIPIVQDERLTEIAFGEWEGLCCRKDNYTIPSRSFSDFFKNPFVYQPPKGGETVAEVCERTKDFYEELIRKPEYQDKTILIASHGCAVRGILNSVYEDKEDFWRGKVPANCSVSIVEVTDGAGRLLEEDKIYYNPDECKDFYGVNH